MQIGEKISALRRAKHCTQKQLAQALQVAPQTIGKWETGIVTNIPSKQIIAMSEYFEVEPSYFFTSNTQNGLKQVLYSLIAKLNNEQLQELVEYVKQNYS